jgi:Lon protease-like protein
VTGGDTPMFPLGTVLLPTAVLPLHVFEPRYRALARRCVDGDEPFGVTLIERGHEVGGGDVRTDVGCLARIVQHRELPDGRWGLACVGTERIRVDEWLPDDPYPRAIVTPWPDPEPDTDLAPAVMALELLLREVLDVAGKAGWTVPPADLELSDDPVNFGYQVTALGPMGPFDRYRSLVAESPAARLELLEEELTAVRAVLESRGEPGRGGQ